MSTPLYPGIGERLVLANDTFPFEPVWASMRTPTYVIPNDGYSVPISVAAGFNVEINTIFDSAPTTNAIEIYFIPTIDDIAEEYLLDTVAAGTDTAYTFSTVNSVQLSGLIRIKNVGTADLNKAWLQQKVWR